MFKNYLKKLFLCCGFLHTFVHLCMFNNNIEIAQEYGISILTKNEPGGIIMGLKWDKFFSKIMSHVLKSFLKLDFTSCFVTP